MNTRTKILDQGDKHPLTWYECFMLGSILYIPHYSLKGAYVGVDGSMSDEVNLVYDGAKLKLEQLYTRDYA
jgi:hypothetical protein